MDTFIFIVNILGTVAFAASGAMIGLRKNMDIFGVCILGLTTATGGGVIRDLILGLTPPSAFRDPTCAMVALATSAVFFSLGAFTVIGVELACSRAVRPTLFLLVFVGVITGVGGGVVRDLLAQEVPYIFVKHIYACASLVGAILCAGMWPHADSMDAMLVGMAAVVIIRCLAAHYRWNLPKAKL